MTYDIDEVNCQRQKIITLRKKLIAEKCPIMRKKYEMEIKVCELKIMIAKIG